MGILAALSRGLLTVLGLCRICRNVSIGCTAGCTDSPGDHKKVNSLNSEASGEVVEILGYQVNGRIWNEI